MNYWNTGTINVSKKYMDVVIDLLETESITCVMEDPDKDTIHIQCEGDIESGLDKVIACCKKKHIYLTGKIDFTGDASGRYVIRSNELHVLSMEECVIADASTWQLLQEIQKRNNVTSEMIKIAENVMNNTPDGDIIDPDTILADIMEEQDFRFTGFAQDIFNIWKASNDKEAVEQMFYEFTDISFNKFLRRCINETTRAK